jgi:hypothetical protein
MEALFPALTDETPARAKLRRFAHPDYFDRYLAQTIPEGDLPDARVAKALSQAANGEPGDLRVLVLFDDEEQATLALSKIRVRYPDINEPWTRGSADEGPVTVELLHAGMELVDELEDRNVSWTSSLSQTTYWMADLLGLLLDSNPSADVDPALAACRQANRRAHVISTATRSLERVRPEAQTALRETLRREAERLIPFLVGDLRLGDDSDGEGGSTFLYAVVEEAGLLPQLRREILAGLEAGDFTLPDVAARLVGFAYLVGGPNQPSSASFSGTLFTKLTDVEADSTDINERGDWSDTSWSRRRQFAAQYIKANPPTPT